MARIDQLRRLTPLFALTEIARMEGEGEINSSEASRLRDQLDVTSEQPTHGAPATTAGHTPLPSGNPISIQARGETVAEAVTGLLDLCHPDEFGVDLPSAVEMVALAIEIAKHPNRVDVLRRYIAQAKVLLQKWSDSRRIPKLLRGETSLSVCYLRFLASPHYDRFSAVVDPAVSGDFNMAYQHSRWTYPLVNLSEIVEASADNPAYNALLDDLFAATAEVGEFAWPRTDLLTTSLNFIFQTLFDPRSKQPRNAELPDLIFLVPTAIRQWDDRDQGFLEYYLRNCVSGRETPVEFLASTARAGLEYAVSESVKPAVVEALRTLPDPS